MGAELLAQSTTRDAQHFCGLGLVARGFLQGNLQDRPFHAGDDHRQQIAWLGFAQIGEVAFEAFTYGLF